jgi:hypothetical protein
MAFNFPAKQDVLVSGTNIKTINSNSLLGSGNLTIGTSFPLLAPDGSLSAPSYSFANAPAAGMYRSTYSGGGIVFASAGVARMELTYYTQINGGLSVNGDISTNNTLIGQTIMATSNFRMNTDKEGYQTYPNGIGIAWQNELLRPSFINSCSWIRVGKKVSSSLTYGGALAVAAPDDIPLAPTTLSSSVNNSTTITFSGVGIPIQFINIGDYLQLSGLPAVGRVIARTLSPFSYTVDTPLGDGTPRVVILKQDIFSVRSNSGTELLVIDRLERTKINGDLILNTAGNGLTIKEGTNAKIGVTGAFPGGGTNTVTVSTTAVTSNSIIFISAVSGATTVDPKVWVSTITAGTSFVISSGDNSFTGTVGWMIVERS